jgi:arylsulfatase A-like enzyme
VLQKGTYTEAKSGSDLYLSPGVFDRLKANPKVLADVQRAIEDLPGVARALRGDELSETSRDPAVRAAALSYAPGRSGDLVIVAEAYWTLAGRGVFAAMHGSMHPYDTHVPLILFGGGIKPGRSTTAATPADIAPTLAQLAGIRMPKAEGRVLREALR